MPHSTRVNFHNFILFEYYYILSHVLLILTLLWIYYERRSREVDQDRLDIGKFQLEQNFDSMLLIWIGELLNFCNCLKSNNLNYSWNNSYNEEYSPGQLIYTLIKEKKENVSNHHSSLTYSPKLKSIRDIISNCTFHELIEWRREGKHNNGDRIF